VPTAPRHTVSFSTLSPSILEREDRLRVGRQILAILEDHLKSVGLAGRSVLDVGCSSGVATAFLAGFAGRTIGIDVDSNALRLAREQATDANVEFKSMSGSTSNSQPRHSMSSSATRFITGWRIQRR
jgi:methylase of polypeptide subunit release factors